MKKKPNIHKEFTAIAPHYPGKAYIISNQVHLKANFDGVALRSINTSNSMGILLARTGDFTPEDSLYLLVHDDIESGMTFVYNIEMREENIEKVGRVLSGGISPMEAGFGLATRMTKWLPPLPLWVKKALWYNACMASHLSDTINTLEENKVFETLAEIFSGTTMVMDITKIPNDLTEEQVTELVISYYDSTAISSDLN